MQNNPKEKSKLNKWLSLVNIPFQMGITIFLFFKGGEWLDNNYPNTIFYYSKVLTMVGVMVALYNVIRQVNKINQ
ncbi:AtpZ/AtpI family protein [Flavobacterium sp. H122]|uniref:AtpZ/AtpI family protein n=1 Tax=Flavobacterium sp. H122 TaxID=2529860 RepID=UPI0010A9AEBD|nr:AtpZ/AtpI family protein [Flavobacterium sp. H122]